jgi:thiamine biosynthesis lipoprotein
MGVAVVPAAPSPPRLKLSGPAMGARWALSCDDSVDRPDALSEELAAAAARVEDQMSPWKPDSDLCRLNRAPPGTWLALPQDLLHVLRSALDMHRLSDGAFDPALGDLVDAWGFGAARAEPDAAAIRAARQARRPDSSQALELDLGRGRLRKHAQVQVDLCGIAKGHAVDAMAAVLRRHGVAHALLALDGELRALGSQADGRPWAVALERPQHGRRAVHGVIELADLALATSGDYRRCLRVGSLRPAHSMDGRRGMPVDNGVASVTVLASACMHADAWATALLVAGSGRGLALAQRHGLDALWLLRREDALVELGSGRFAACAPTASAPGA